jgi:hypothetical protein
MGYGGGMSITGIGEIASLAEDLVDKAFPDKEKQAEARAKYLLQAQELDNQLALAQIAVDEKEAGSNSIFVAGARPFIEWGCGFALIYHLILQPAIAFGAALHGTHYIMPTFDISTLKDILMTLLGFGTLHGAVEKANGLLSKR